jgi:hypothetical protein
LSNNIGYIKHVVLASKDDKLEFIFNAKGMNAILNGLGEFKFVKVMCKVAREVVGEPRGPIVIIVEVIQCKVE